MGFISNFQILGQEAEMGSRGGLPHVAGWSTLTSLLRYTDVRQGPTQGLPETVAPAETIQTWCFRLGC